VIRSAVVAPPLVGALYVLLLAVGAGSGREAHEAAARDVRHAKLVEAFVAQHYEAELVRTKLAVVAAAIGLGIVIGFVAELLVRMRHPLPRLVRRSFVGALVESVLVVATLHSAFVLWGMADAPQLYATRWYARGGLPRTVQVLATDVLGTRGVVLATAALAVAYVRPTRIAYLARRALVLLRRPLRIAALSAGRKSIAPIAVLAVAAAALADAPAPAEAGQEPQGPRAPEGREPPNVLVLGVGSLRNDRLDPRVAPNLSRLAERGTRFDRAYVSIPRTFPSWVTILTGRHPHHHGIRSTFPTPEERAKELDALPGRFARAGYATSVVGDWGADVFGRVDLGFDRVQAPALDFRRIARSGVLERETPLLPLLRSRLGRKLFPAMHELPAAGDPNLVADDVEAALRAVRKGPFFLTAVFSTPRAPYAAPAPYYGRYTSSAYRGRYKYQASLGSASEIPPDDEDVRQIRALYDGAVTAVDDAVGRVLRTLDRLGLSGRTIIVLTADHGETLFDDGHGHGHGDHLFGDEGTHVPLVIYDPRLGANAAGSSAEASKDAPAGHRVASIVRDVDIAPTLYELAGIASPPDLDGRSLVPALRGEPLEPRWAYAETELWLEEEIRALPSELRLPYPGVEGLVEISGHDPEIVLRREMVGTTLMARHRMVRDERWKLLYVPTRRGVRYMLFDTETDPGETTDVAARHPEQVARLRAELWAWMLKDPLVERKDGYLVPRAARGAKGEAR